MADFIDFIVKVSENPDLGKELLEKLLEMASVEELGKWFKSKGYDVPQNDLQRIFDNRKAIAASGDVSVKGTY